MEDMTRSNPHDLIEGLWPSVWVMVATVLSLIILFLIISKLIYFPIKNALQARQDRIQKDFDDAAKINSDSVETSKKIEKEYKGIKKERAKIINTSKSEARKLQNEIINKAKKDAEEIIKKAYLEIEKERDLILEELRTQISSISVSVAEKIIEEKIDTKINQKMIDELINDIK